VGVTVGDIDNKDKNIIGQGEEQASFQRPLSQSPLVVSHPPFYFAITFTARHHYYT
jgi:hypothetical protein